MLGRRKFDGFIADCEGIAGATEVLQSVRQEPWNRSGYQPVRLDTPPIELRIKPRPAGEIAMLFRGQTVMHMPQPLHLASSNRSVATFGRYRYLVIFIFS